MNKFTNSETSQPPLKFIILANINNNTDNNTEKTNCNNAFETLQIYRKL